MALTPEQIDAEAFARWGEMKGAPLAMCRGFARAIEAEVRKDDEALIRQMREALRFCCTAVDYLAEDESISDAITAADARLEKAP